MAGKTEPSAISVRATVVGASQYTVQLSGTTIYIDPPAAVPLRNVPVVVPEFDLSPRDLDSDAVADAIAVALTRLDLADKDASVALGFRWQGSASYQRLDAFCRGVRRTLAATIDANRPLVLVSEGDIGGLVGIHLREEAKLAAPVISVDGITLQEFDYIDIGAMLPSSGAVPVVIKSLVFPGA